jgi:hypothetical protein
MSFHVPSDELDFAIYGDANTNQLQLSTSQHRLLQKQRLDIAAVMPQVQAEEGEQNLTGYQSGLFDPLGKLPTSTSCHSYISGRSRQLPRSRGKNRE